MLTRHARERAGQRKIGDRILIEALSRGEVLEEYPQDPRGASALLLSHAGDGRPFHAVCAFDHNGILLIITVYTPELPAWLDERTRRPGKVQ